MKDCMGLKEKREVVVGSTTLAKTVSRASNYLRAAFVRVLYELYIAGLHLSVKAF